MTLDNIHSKLDEELNAFFTRIGTIEKSITRLQLDMAKDRESIAGELEFQKKESVRIETLSRQADRKVAEAESTFKESESKLREAKRVLDEAHKEEASIKKRSESISIQEESAQENLREANKKMAWAEMWERQLKMLEKKLDLIQQDEHIKKKLKELT